MKRARHSYQHPLTVSALPVMQGAEWLPSSSGWSLVQVESGLGYWLQTQSYTELGCGTVLLIAGQGQGRIRASQLDAMSLRVFNVIPSRISGFFTLDEQNFLKASALRPELAFQIFQPSNAISVRVKNLYASHNREGLALRLALLQLFVEIFGDGFVQTAPYKGGDDAKERLRVYLGESPPDALLDVSFDELAQAIHCTPRHLSRIFSDLVGMSFRDKCAEIRLARAQDLLVTTRAKVLEVASESGFNSVSLFNLMFTRHFGLSPTKWRKKHAENGAGENPRIDSARRRHRELQRRN